jgi:4a-hydroxytetrahydrobiopterin dehydratase
MKNLPSDESKRCLSSDEIKQAVSDLTPSWKVVKNHHLVRHFAFRNFKEALSFVNEVGLSADELKHHPDIVLKYGKVDITLYSHDIDGLSNKDFELAHKIEADFSSYK